ncbi:MAG: hypothetical protein EOO70_03635 [Myxococcaceae bacterium]|nr:MAG: hypothetical protein EOO70_03635 [Myxococcaceae bacterium]
MSNLRVGAHCYNMDYCKSHTSSPYYARSKFRTPRQNGGFPVVGYEYRTDSGTYYRSSTSTTKRDVPVSMKTRFKGVQAPGKPSLKVRVYPLTRIPGKSELVRGAPATAGGFYPWGRPLRPTKAYQSKHRVTFNCNKGNGRNAVIDKLQQSPGAAVTVKKGNRGCSRITYVWKTIPKGGRRCATVRVKNRYAVGVKRTLCTLRNS